MDLLWLQAHAVYFVQNFPFYPDGRGKHRSPRTGSYKRDKNGASNVFTILHYNVLQCWIIKCYEAVPNGTIKLN